MFCDYPGTDNENEKVVGEADPADVQVKQSTTKFVDMKEVMRVDSILAGIMRKVMNMDPAINSTRTRYNMRV